MKLAGVASGLLALAGVARAQTMPLCASNCLTTSLESSPCIPTNTECICTNQTLISTIQTCILGSCTIVEALSAQNATVTLCNEPIRDKSLIAPIATAITGSLALAFVSLRVYDCVEKKEYRWADLCAVLAMISSVPMDVFEFYMMSSGMGKDVWTLTPTQITNAAKYTWVTQVSYIPAIVLTKVAILCFFMQVFPVARFQRLCQGTIVFCFLFMISTTIAAILACIPVELAWSNRTGVGEGICYNNSVFWWAHSAINITTDLWILALPIPLLLRLQLRLKKKIYLLLMFSVGLFITVMSIVRFSGLITYSTTANITYNNVMVATYSVIECNVSIMCCCMPALLSCLRRAFPSVFDSSTRDLQYNDSPFPSNGIQKTVSHQVTYITTTDTADDVVELVDRKLQGGCENGKRESAW